MTGDQAYATLKNLIKDTLTGGGALKGQDGKSAYQLAVDAGYTGTLDEWLDQLVGKDGKSAYDIAVEHGFTGTEEEWLESLMGKEVSGTPSEGNYLKVEVMDRGEYEALPIKDPDTLYMLRG